MKKPDNKTIWLIILSVLVITQLPILGLTFILGVVAIGRDNGISMDDHLELQKQVSDFMEVYKDYQDGHREYVNTVAGVIYRQSVTNCEFAFEINLLNGIDYELANDEFNDCKFVGELGLRVLNDLKENPEKFTDKFDPTLGFEDT